MKEIFYELISEAVNGKVFIDDEEWGVGFNTKISSNQVNYFKDSNLSCLTIENEELFLAKLTEYVFLELEKNRPSIPFINDNKETRIKFIMTYLFVNASTEDFLKPIEFIERRIAFLKDETFEDFRTPKVISTSSLLLNSEIEIENVPQSLMMETPFKLDLIVKSRDNEYPLASVFYGIQSNDREEATCYIYAISKNKNYKAKSLEEEKYQKKVNRLLYKLNDGLKDYENPEYFEYKESSINMYPENITDVTLSFVLTLSIFINLLQSKGINKIIGVPYLPLRYLSREIAKDNLDNEEKRQLLQQRNQIIQENLTNKFIRTFRRVSFHMPNFKITSYPYELDENLICYIKESQEINNPLLEEITDNMNIEYSKGRR